jgi:two-component system nitrate/nitrite sensor histidine kinase NarX
MTKKVSSLLHAADAGFAWVDNVVFTPPPDNPRHASLHASAASRARDLGPLLDDFLETIVENVNASAGVIRLHPLNSPTLQTISSCGLPDELFEVKHLVEFDCELRGKAAIEQEIYSSDLSVCTTRANCHHPDCLFKSAISLPIESHAPLASPIGIITLFFNTSHTFSHRASNTVLAFAKILGSSIEHIRSTRESKRADRMAARQAIANEIHDSLAQTLVYTRMRTSLLSESIRKGDDAMAAGYAQDIDEGLEYSQKTVRELIRDFRCEMDPAGLLHAVQKLIEQFDERNDIALIYLNHVADLELPLEYEIEVFYIVREALTNIAKHSGASHARLLVDFISGYYVFTIEDNGIGGATFAPVEGHYGMMIMRERAHRIGGEIKVGSAAGLGTQVQLFFPEPSLDWRIINE